MHNEYRSGKLHIVPHLCHIIIQMQMTHSLQQQDILHKHFLLCHLK